MRRPAVARVLTAAPTQGMLTPVTLEAFALDEVAQLTERGSGSSAKKAKRLVRRAKRVLSVAERAAKRDTKGKKPKLTAARAGSIGAAAEEVQSGLGS
jgi:hypothetical protein